MQRRDNEPVRLQHCTLGLEREDGLRCASRDAVSTRRVGQEQFSHCRCDSCKLDGRHWHEGKVFGKLWLVEHERTSQSCESTCSHDDVGGHTYRGLSGLEQNWFQATCSVRGWYGDFHLDQVLGHDSTCSSASRGCLYSAMCLKGSSYPTGPKMVTDYFLLVDRVVAHVFVDLYSQIVKPNSLARKVIESEQFIMQLAVATHIKVVRLPQDKLPFQRLGRRKKLNGTIEVCLHKVCTPVGGELSTAVRCDSR
mmetsp:Transcript_66385/g.215981  ORF Transcript_66385/g.215981 Transcript_66385/m.215981 type:complete len:252 (-) Transcript_66385:183-938(-)